MIASLCHVCEAESACEAVGDDVRDCPIYRPDKPRLNAAQMALVDDPSGRQEMAVLCALDIGLVRTLGAPQ